VNSVNPSRGNTGHTAPLGFAALSPGYR